MEVTETQRLIIRHLELKDKEFIFELTNSPNWLEYIGNRGINTLDLAEEYISSQEEHCDKTGFCLYAMILKEKQKVIGLCGFLKREYLDSADIGFAILPEYEGKGYTFEACQTLIQYGLDELKINPIYAITSEKNIKSQNLLKKLGLRYISKIKAQEDSEEILLFEL